MFERNRDALATSVPNVPAHRGPRVTAEPEELGFSAERLKRIGDVFQAEVERGAVPGAVILVQRAGKVVYLRAIGYRVRETKAPMTSDAVFRGASLTKLITSVAAMMLTEEGKLQIGYPVSRYLPVLKDVKVGVETTEPSTGKAVLALEAVGREMTIQDLLRHTSGLTYGEFGDSMVKTAYRDADIMADDQTNAEFLEKLAKLPLAYQPGTVWEYGMSTDVLGCVVEAVSGTTLDRFIDERIVKPLGLSDTMFRHPDASRIAEPQPDPYRKLPKFATKDPTIPRKFISGGGGMVTTAADYARFAQMMLNGGELEGERLLAPATVGLMTCDHLPPGIGFGRYTTSLFGSVSPIPELGYGFGLGVAVRKEPGLSALPGSVGDYFWGGATGTYYWVDPKLQLVAVLMMQAPLDRLHYRYLMRHLVYQSIVGPVR